MRIFHEQIFDGNVSQGSVYTYSFLSVPLMRKLGSVDMVHVGGYASNVVGTLPTLTIISRKSDGLDFLSKDTILTTLSLSTTGETLIQCADASAATVQKYCYLYFVLQLGGTGTTARVRLWATGRDWSKRAHNIAIGKGCDYGGSCSDKSQNGKSAATSPAYKPGP